MRTKPQRSPPVAQCDFLPGVKLCIKPSEPMRRDATRCDATMAWHGMAWHVASYALRFEGDRWRRRFYAHISSSSIVYAGLIIPWTKGSPADDAQVSSETLMRGKENCLYTTTATIPRQAGIAPRGVYNFYCCSFHREAGNMTRNVTRSPWQGSIISANWTLRT